MNHLKEILPFISIFIALIALYIGWRYYKNNRNIKLRDSRKDCIKRLKNIKNKINFPNGEWANYLIPRINDNGEIKYVHFSDNYRYFNEIREIFSETRELFRCREKRIVKKIESDLEKLCKATNQIDYSHIKRPKGIEWNRPAKLKEMRNLAFNNQLLPAKAGSLGSAFKADSKRKR